MTPGCAGQRLLLTIFILGDFDSDNNHRYKFPAYVVYENTKHALCIHWGGCYSRAKQKHHAVRQVFEIYPACMCDMNT